MPIAPNARFIAHSLSHSLAERDAHIFHRVMPVNVQIAFGMDRQIHQAMASDLIEHVVKKANASLQISLACAVEVDGHGDLGFFGVSGNGGGAHGLIVAG